MKQEGSAGPSLYIILHLANPRAGRHDFMSWLPTSLDPLKPRVEGLVPTLGSLKRTGQKSDAGLEVRAHPIRQAR